MNKKLTLAVTTEPVTLAEALAQIRQSTNDLAGSVTNEQSIAPGSHIAGAVNGASSDVFGYSPIVFLEAGANGSGGTVDVVIEESDDNITFTAWASFTQVTEANDNQTFEKAYTGSQRYIRAVATTGIASCSFAVSIMLYAITSDESDLITSLITIAREYGEDYTGQAFAPQTWVQHYNDFPAVDYLKWARAPLTSVSEVTYTDSDNTETTMVENTDYVVDVDTFPGKIYLPYNESWPSFTSRPYNAVAFTGVCGYTGVAPYIMPHNFKQAMLVHIGLMYRYRDEEVPDNAMKTIHRLYWLRGGKQV